MKAIGSSWDIAVSVKILQAPAKAFYYTFGFGGGGNYSKDGDGTATVSFKDMKAGKAVALGIKDPAGTAYYTAPGAAVYDISMKNFVDGTAEKREKSTGLDRWITHYKTAVQQLIDNGIKYE